jgi:hypothetical protein
MREHMNETRSIGARTLVGAIQAPRSFANGRVCIHDDCGTQLSIYNDGRYCSLHLPRSVPRQRGRKTSDVLARAG